jgi:CheY-like chemotaxis protein/protein-arginine kinase activator protein McsA
MITPQVKKPTVLLVDDEAIIRDSVSEWLKSSDFEVDCASNGIEALECVRKKRFDTAVVDLKMPGMDGLEVMRQVKQNYPQINIIIITAYGTVENAVEALKGGASDYLEKPFNPEELIKAIEKNMGLKKDSLPHRPIMNPDPKEYRSDASGENPAAKKSTGVITRSFILGILIGISIGCGIVMLIYLLNPLDVYGKSHYSTPSAVLTDDLKAPDNSMMTDVENYKRLYPNLTESFNLYSQINNLQQEYFNKIKPVVSISDEEIKYKIGQGIFLLKDNDFAINYQLFQELKEALRKVIGKYNPRKSASDIEEMASFHALAPFYRKEAYQFKDKIDENAWLKGICPVCGTMPLMGKLEKTNGKLLLHCPLCETNWRFPRVTCAFCNNTEQDSIGYFYADGRKAYRVNVCEQCKKYIKIVDERILDKEPVFQVENIVTGYLDHAAKQEGYQTAGNNGYIK